MEKPRISEKAESLLRQRGYDIVPASQVREKATEALLSGAFVQGFEELSGFSSEWVSSDSYILEREFYRRTENYPEGEFGKAVAYVDNGEIYDFYVTDHQGNEI